MSTYYLICFILSFLLAAVYIFRWNHRYSIYITMLYIFIPVANVGYWQLSLATQLEQAILANKILYLGACFTPLGIVLSILFLCKIHVNHVFHKILFFITFLVYTAALTVGYSPIFYKSVALQEVKGNYVLVKEYGWGHNLFYAMLVLYLGIGFAALIYAMKNNKDVSMHNIILLFATNFISVFGFFIGRMLGFLELSSATYVLALLLFLALSERLALYNVDETVISSLLSRGDLGVASFDWKHKYLGSNNVAKEFYPILSKLRVDKRVDSSDVDMQELMLWIEQVEKTGELFFEYQREHRYFRVTASFLYAGKAKKGYHFIFQECTEEKEREEKLRLVAITDELTKLYNRRAFEHDIDTLEKEGLSEYTVVVSTDLNGLKAANDTLGHAAGDEMIMGAADCLQTAFGDIGKIYRTGGDEFICILHCDSKTLEKALHSLEKATENWTGKKIHSMTISKGTATHLEFPGYSVSQLEKEADKRMYLDKEAYYKRTGIERR